jgi:hypothetical protein
MRRARRDTPEPERGERDARLSGRIVGQLVPAEQLVLWAMRQRLADGGALSATFAEGFRLAFGMRAMEAALVAFEGMFNALARHASHDICLCPPRCACVSLDEERILRLVTAAQQGSEHGLEMLVAQLVEQPARPALRRHALMLAFSLLRVDLRLPSRPGPAPIESALLH